MYRLNLIKTMNTEKLIAKKVKHNFNQKLKQVLFDVESLKEHFDGLLIHESDILYLEEDDVIYGYVKVGDVSFDNAVPKEVVEEVTAETFEETPELVLEEIKVEETIGVDDLELKAEQIIQGIKPDGISIDLDTIEEIIPEKVVKKKKK